MRGADHSKLIGAMLTLVPCSRFVSMLALAQAWHSTSNWISSRLGFGAGGYYHEYPYSRAGVQR
jgi:hypothetical protein